MTTPNEKDIIVINNNLNKILKTPTTKDQDETFNKLLELQLLIKKESGLKELCKEKLLIIYNIYSLQRP